MAFMADISVLFSNDDPEADIIFCSRDKVLFYIRSQILEFACEDFPPSHINRSNIIGLKEDSSTLELMFELMYPRPQPDLENLPFDGLARLSEAVEKYKVYPAMQLCKVLMAKAIPKHPLKVLEYSVKHNYPDLSNSAALSVTLMSMSNSSKSVSNSLISVWLRYYNAWDVRKNTALRTCHSLHHPCPEWPDHQRDIYKALGSGTGVGNLGSIRSAFDIPHALPCCKATAASWKSKFLEKMGTIHPFTKFL